MGLFLKQPLEMNIPWNKGHSNQNIWHDHGEFIWKHAQYDSINHYKNLQSILYLLMFCTQQHLNSCHALIKLPYLTNSIEDPDETRGKQDGWNIVGEIIFQITSWRYKIQLWKMMIGKNKISDVYISGILKSNKEPIGWVTMLIIQVLEGP